MKERSSANFTATFHLRRRTPGSFVMVPCPKIGRALRCQGQLERATATVLSNCPSVTCIQEQPMKLWYGWRDTPQGTMIRLLQDEPRTRRDQATGERFSYIVPDFLVSMTSGRSRLIEVKPSRKLDQAIVQRKLAVAATFAASRKWTFHVITERQLFSTPLVRNLGFVARYRVLDERDEISALVLNRVTKSGMKIGEIVSNFKFAPSATKLHVLHLIALERLSFDPVFQEVCDDSCVFPEGVISWDPFDSAWASSSYSMDGPIKWSVNSPTTALLQEMPNSK